MKSNSSAGDGKNNNHDPTLRDHESGKGPAQTALKDREFDPTPPPPSDKRESRQ